MRIRIVITAAVLLALAPAAAAAQAPSVATRSAAEVRHDSALLRAWVNPQGRPASAFFEYGTTTGLGSRTPDVQAGTGTALAPVSARVTSLPAATTVYFRVVATNDRGTVRSSLRSFTTTPGRRTLSITAPRRVPYGENLIVEGRLRDGTVPVEGAEVALVARLWPYRLDFRQVGKTLRSDAAGRVRFDTGPLIAGAQVRLVTRGSHAVLSRTRRLASEAVVGLMPVRVMRGGRMRFTGTVWPGLRDATASLQRRTADGWRTVVRSRMSTTTVTRTRSRSRYAITIRRRPGTWRVLIVPRDGGAHAIGISRVRASR